MVLTNMLYCTKCKQHFPKDFTAFKRHRANCGGVQNGVQIKKDFVDYVSYEKLAAENEELKAKLKKKTKPEPETEHKEP